MKKIIIILSVFFIITKTFGEINRYKKGNLVIENIPEIPVSLIKKLTPYQNTRYASFRDWLPNDKGMIIRTRLGNVSQIHLVETPKGFRKQLTFSNEPLDVATICPNPQNPFFLFTRDSAGNEVDQIYKFNYITGKHRLLTDGKSKHLAPRWSNKGDKFAFSRNIQNTRDFDIYLGTLKGEKSPQQILEKGGYWYPVDFSPDDKNLLVKKYISANESYYYVLDINKKTIIQINPADKKIAYGQAYWARNGKGVYLVSDQFSNFKQLLYYELETKHNDILTKQIPWDIEEFELSPSGDTIVFVSNEGGISKLYFLNTKTRTITRAHLPDGLIYNLKFQPDGMQLAMVINTPTSPSDVYTLNLKEKIFIRWTYSEVAGIDTSSFSQAQLIHYQTFDSIDGEPRLIPAFYYKPTTFKPPYPVLIMCHGGPESQYTPGFYTIIQFYLNKIGIAVIAPNIRGSSGYGKEYVTLDNGYKREDAVKDIGALLDWIDKQPELDASRICIEGGSYGGYMVLASMVHYSNRLRCGMGSVGISNFVTFLENTGKYRQDLRRVEYGDERDPRMRKFLNEISPLTNAHKIIKPLFIAQGLHDPRVPVTEAEQIVKAVRKNGVDVWYLLAEDEGHGFAKKSNRDFYIQTQILFLEKYLLK